MGYSQERKEAVLKKMLPPNNMAIAELAKQEGISEATLYGWRKQARNAGQLMPNADDSPAGWSSRDKFAAVLSTATMSEAEIAEYCRQQGLYPHQVSQWRAACEQANDWDQATAKQLKETTRADRKKLKQLENELSRKEKALAEAAALLVLRKKLNAMFEEHGDD